MGRGIGWSPILARYGWAVHPDIEQLADQLVAARFKQEPLEAALLGLPEGDVGLADLTRHTEEELTEIFASIASTATTLSSRLHASSASLDEVDVLTLDLVRLTAESLVENLRVPLVEFAITDLFSAPLSGLISTLPMVALDTPDRHSAHLRRLEQLPVFLEQVAQRHLDGVAAGRLPNARGVRAAIEQIDSVLGDPSLSGIRRGQPETDGAAFVERESGLIDDTVMPAIRQYRAVLEVQILSPGRSDEEPGLCWLPEGEAMYSRLVRASTSTERTAEELHSTGLSIIEQLSDEFSVIGTRLWKTGDVAEIHSRLRSDPELRYESGDEILATALAAVARAERSAPQWFGLVPETACAVQPIPEALAEGSPPAYYYTGALDGSRVGTYFINTTKPGERFRHLAEAVAFHEAVPGHHFQLTIAQELKGNHLAMSVFGDVATAEGWGLYAERLADEMGLYSSDVSRLGMVSTDAWRAARLVIDTGLHAFGWTRQRAIDWMTEHVPMSPLEIRSEVDRYIAVPGQALSYMVGRLQIEACRREAAERLDERFNVKSFHDVVLRSGPVPLPALTASVDRWIESQSRAAL